MATFRVETQFTSSPKVMQIPLSDRFACLGLWTMCGSWCAVYKTNGYVPSVILTELFQPPERLAEALVRVDLWRKVEGGYQFVHWRKSQDGDYRKNIPKRVRAAVMKRDGNRCVLCGSEEQLSLDHIIRYRDDGPDTAENLRVLCMPCNWGRG